MSSTKKRWFALPLAALLVACGPHYERHEVNDVQASQGGFLSQGSLEVRVPEGAVITAELIPYNSDDEIMGGSEILSANNDILEVIPLVDEPDSFAFVGRRAGTTEVIYFAEGEEVRRERATVTAQ